MPPAPTAYWRRWRIRASGWTATSWALPANTDITERESAERALRDLLLAELNHRVKNTLAVVQGLVHQTFRNTDQRACRAFEGRLLALAAAHDLLTRSHWETTSLDQLVHDTLQLAGTNRSRITAVGPPIRLSPHAALAITLALHELFTNTLKYGALSNAEGKVRLDWRHFRGRRQAAHRMARGRRCHRGGGRASRLWIS